MNQQTENSLLNVLRELQPDMLRFCQRLIQTPSVNGVDDEAHLAHVIAEESKHLGLHVLITGQDQRRPNIIVSTKAEGETGLLLLGHLDTVPTGDPNKWSHPPFAGVIANDRLYGRGAIDTKGGMAAAVYALAALQRVPDALPYGRAQFIGVPDEETGATGTLGIRYLTAQGLLQAKGAIYAYSGNEIVLGHRGLLRYRICAKGEAIHTGSHEWQERSAGANAVTAVARFLLALEERRFPSSSAPYFERYRTVVTPGTMIQGGVSVNIVPESCEALVDIRTTPEYTTLDLETWFAEIAANIPNVWFSFECLNHIPAVCSDPGAAIFRILSEVTERVCGAAPVLTVAGPANEGYLLIEHGIPTVCGFGPIGANAHATDEFLEIPSLFDAARIFTLTARRLSNELHLAQ